MMETRPFTPLLFASVRTIRRSNRKLQFVVFVAYLSPLFFLLALSTSKEVLYWLRGEHIRSRSLWFRSRDVKLIFDEPLQTKQYVGKKPNLTKLWIRENIIFKAKQGLLQLAVWWSLDLYQYASQVLVV